MTKKPKKMLVANLFYKRDGKKKLKNRLLCSLPSPKWHRELLMAKYQLHMPLVAFTKTDIMITIT